MIPREIGELIDRAMTSPETADLLERWPAGALHVRGHTALVTMQSLRERGRLEEPPAEPEPLPPLRTGEPKVGQWARQRSRCEGGHGRHGAYDEPRAKWHLVKLCKWPLDPVPKKELAMTSTRDIPARGNILSRFVVTGRPVQQMSNRYPRRVAEAYGRDLAAAASDEEVARMVAYADGRIDLPAPNGRTHPDRVQQATSATVNDVKSVDGQRTYTAENMQEWEHSAEIEQETVRAVIEAYGAGQLPELSSDGQTKGNGRPREPLSVDSIAGFLGWKRWKIETALKAIRAIEQGVVAEDDFVGLGPRTGKEIVHQAERATRIARMVAEWERLEGLEPRDWQAIGRAEKGEDE